MYPRLYNSSGELLAVLNNIIDESAKTKRVVNGEFTFSFDAYEAQLKSEYFDPANDTIVDGQTFDIKYVEQLHEGSVEYTIQAEHAIYRLEDGVSNLYEDGYTYLGTPTEILTDILSGTDFSVGTIDFTDIITLSINEKITKKKLIKYLANYIGGELDYSNNGFTVDILATIGQDNGYEARFGKNLKGVTKIIDDRGSDTTTYYKADLLMLKNTNTWKSKDIGDLEVVGVGDTIKLIDSVTGLNITNRVISIEYNPILEVNTKVEIANKIELITDVITDITTNVVYKDEEYNKVSISNEYGFRSELASKLARTTLSGGTLSMDVGDGLGAYTPALYFSVAELKFIFDGLLSANTIQASQAEIEAIISNVAIIQTLSADKATIAELTVDRLNTSDAVGNYKLRISDPEASTADIDYIDIRDEEIKFWTASTTGTSTIHVQDRLGNLLYWTDETEIATTIDPTAYPVYRWEYETELEKGSIIFETDIAGNKVFTIWMGVGSEATGNKGRVKIEKDFYGYKCVYYHSTTEVEHVFAITDAGIVLSPGINPLTVSTNEAIISLVSATPNEQSIAFSNIQDTYQVVYVDIELPAAANVTVEIEQDDVSQYIYTNDGGTKCTFSYPVGVAIEGDHTIDIIITSDTTGDIAIGDYNVTIQQFPESYTIPEPPTPIVDAYKITIDHTKIDADLTDYPVRVKLEDGPIPFSADGTIYHFTDSNGSTELSFERAYYDASIERSEFWVKIPLVSSTEDTVFYLMADSESDVSNPSSVWDADYLAVWHMYSASTYPSSTEDSTSNNNDLTNIASSTFFNQGNRTTCEMYGGDDDKLTTPDMLSAETEFSLECVYKLDDISVDRQVFGNWDVGAQILVYHDAPNGWRLLAKDNADAFIASLQTSLVATASATEYEYLGFSLDNGTSVAGYLNTTKESGITTNTNAIKTDANVSNIGHGANADSREWSGRFDELRISKTSRSDAWHKANYYNFKEDTSDLISITPPTSDYLYSSTITIDSTKVDADLTDYPVKVTLTDTNFSFSSTKSDGTDIAFFDNDGNLLDFELDYFDASSQLGVFHVKVPSVSSASDTTFKMYYGNADAPDLENKNAVWDDDYVFVHHMNPDFADSSGNGHTLTNYGTVDSGGIGRAFDGINDYMEMADSVDFDVSAYTLQAIVDNSAFNTWDGIQLSQILLRTPSDTTVGFYDLHTYLARPRTKIRTTSGVVSAWSADAISVDISYLLQSKWDGSNLDVFEGETEKDTQAIAGTLSAVAGAFQVGYRSTTSFEYYFDGIMYEIRMSKIARSDAWLKADYYNLIDSVDLITITEDVAPTYGEYQLLADIVVTSPTSQVDITGLNLTEDDEILLVSEINVVNASSGSGFHLFVNNDLTDSKHYSQRLSANNISISSGKNNNADVSRGAVGDTVFAYINIKVTESGYVTYQTCNSKKIGTSNTFIENFTTTTDFTVSSITQITIQDDVAEDAIGIGSRFLLYRKGET